MSTPVSSTVCSLCGQMLEREGACLACLLRGGLDESEKEPLPSNSLVFGDFEIERRDDGSFWELGRGAMGVTYRARDKSAAPPGRAQGDRGASKGRGRPRYARALPARGPRGRGFAACQCRERLSIRRAERNRSLLLRDGAGGGRNPRNARAARRSPASRSSARNRDPGDTRLGRRGGARLDSSRSEAGEHHARA